MAAFLHLNIGKFSGCVAGQIWLVRAVAVVALSKSKGAS
jgi:hypothetical protein